MRDPKEAGRKALAELMAAPLIGGSDASRAMRAFQLSCAECGKSLERAGEDHPEDECVVYRVMES